MKITRCYICGSILAVDAPTDEILAVIEAHDAWHNNLKDQITAALTTGPYGDQEPQMMRSLGGSNLD